MNFLQIEQNRWVESINDGVGSLHFTILIPLHQIWVDLPPESQPTTVSSVFLVEHRDKSAIYKQFIKLLDCWMFHCTQSWNNMISKCKCEMNTLNPFAFSTQILWFWFW